jgi:hypothetical protein
MREVPHRRVTAERYRIFHGPYHAPALRKGDRTTCLLRDCGVVVTAWTDAPISWPRCRALGRRGGSGVLLCEELARAVRHEAAIAIAYWSNVGLDVVWRWRTALGVTVMNNERSHELIKAASEAGAEKTRDEPLSSEQVERRRQTALDLGLGRNLRRGGNGQPWTQDQLGRLGKEPDDVLAREFGRTVGAVRVMRARLGIPTVRDRRRSGGRPSGPVSLLTQRRRPSLAASE